MLLKVCKKLSQLFRTWIKLDFMKILKENSVYTVYPYRIVDNANQHLTKLESYCIDKFREPFAQLSYLYVDLCIGRGRSSNIKWSNSCTWVKVEIKGIIARFDETYTNPKVRLSITNCCCRRRASTKDTKRCKILTGEITGEIISRLPC